MKVMSRKIDTTYSCLYVLIHAKKLKYPGTAYIL